MIVDDLLDLTSGTPAEDYVNELVARSDLGEAKKTREGGGLPPAGIVYRGSVPETSPLIEKTAVSFGTTLTESSSGVTAVKQVPIFFSTNRAPSTMAGTSFAGEFQRASPTA